MRPARSEGLGLCRHGALSCWQAGQRDKPVSRASVTSCGAPCHPEQLALPVSGGRGAGTGVRPAAVASNEE